MPGNLKKSARAVSNLPGEGLLPRMAGAQRWGVFLTNVEINIDVPGRQQHAITSRDDIVQAVLAAHSAGGLTVKFPDINVMVDAAKETAQADITVEARVPGDRYMVVQAMSSPPCEKSTGNG